MKQITSQAPQLAGKGSVYEGGTRVHTMQIDLYNTLLDLADELPDIKDGSADARNQF